ncbi:hypothetical protein SEUCBS140593_010780 [Sporothrix eucalyptigena]|uniref:C6 zinc finger domain containing protein n=1 Tax=Sporothrix eucalyptigena TaxID=1812306 RepID=A0ABP0D519_9PEZI
MQHVRTYCTPVNGALRQAMPPGDPAILDYDKASAGVVLSWPPIAKRLRDIIEAYEIYSPAEYPTRYEQQRGISSWRCRCQDEPSNGVADFHQHTVWTYVESYKENIQNMHPLISPERLRVMVFETVSRASNTPTGRALKRRRGSRAGSGNEALAAPPEFRIDQLPCCVESALVLMVLALGKICLHRRMCGADSAAEMRACGDVLGSDYFRRADGIFRALQDAPTLEHVWFLILGSLYYDQVGQPVESFNLLTKAGGHLRDIIQPDLERYIHIRESAAAGQQCKPGDPAMSVADNEKLVAAWTCLLLEGGILTELQLHPSNMLSGQQLPYPDGLVWHDQGFEKNVIEAFAWQMHMYVLVQEVRHNLKGEIKAPMIEACIQGFESHASSNPAFRNSSLFDRNLRATDILAARLRVTYWGAELLVYRHYIQQILTFNHANTAEGASKDGGLVALAKEAEVVNKFTLEMAKRGIHALVQSTSAFHDLPNERFVITNMYSIAHAQWGNLLILDSAQRDPSQSQTPALSFLT